MDNIIEIQVMLLASIQAYKYSTKGCLARIYPEFGSLLPNHMSVKRGVQEPPSSW